MQTAVRRAAARATERPICAQCGSRIEIQLSKDCFNGTSDLAQMKKVLRRLHYDVK